MTSFLMCLMRVSRRHLGKLLLCAMNPGLSFFTVTAGRSIRQMHLHSFCFKTVCNSPSQHQAALSITRYQKLFSPHFENYMEIRDFLFSVFKNPQSKIFSFSLFERFVFSAQITTSPKVLICKALSKKPALILDKTVRKSRLVH